MAVYISEDHLRWYNVASWVGAPTNLTTIVFLFILIPAPVSTNIYIAQLSGVNYTVPGDINLGGIIPLHTYDETSQSCGAIRSINALKKVEAMVYAIDQVNRNATLLPNITIGFEIHDTCSYNAVTLGECLNFIPTSSDQCCGDIDDDNTTSSCPVDRPPIVGVVGAQRSSSSVQAAILLGLYHIPQVSYLSTSDELSNDLRYPYFLRTVGPDSYQVKAMIDILLHYRWTYASFVNSDDTYGKSAQQRFTSLAGENNICIGITRTISLFADDESYEEVVGELIDIQDGSHAAVVILFVQLEMAQDIFSAASRMGAERRFIWIGSDGWGNYGDDATRGNEQVALGSFTVVPSSGTLPEFNEYFRSLTPDVSSNPWILEFLRHYTNCSMNDASTSRPLCSTPGLIAGLDSDESSHETLVMDSVYTFAYALHNMIRDLCPDNSTMFCSAVESNGTETLLEYMKKTSFISPANGNVTFLPNGDMSGRYSIKNLQHHGGNNYTFVTVGKWDETGNMDNVITEQVPWYIWDEHPRQNDTGVPKSICSDPCGMGERRNVNPDNPCCWACTECYEHEIVINNGTECKTCLDVDSDLFGWPNGNFTECIPINPVFRVKDNAWAIAIISFSVVGILITFFIIGLYIHNQETPLIKASSRELSYIIFAGIMLSYTTALLFGISPSTGVCVMRRLGQPIANSLIYVSLATKTVRLFRIFRASMKTAKRPKFISSTFQVTFTLGITGIPILWTIIWMIIEPPLVTIQMPYENQNYLQITCVLSDIETIGIMTWNICIVLICCVFAFLTRKLPENYNETRFIAFCAFCTFVVFLTFSPIYFTAREAYYQASYSSLGLIVNASVTLVCLYVVKLYAIYFVDLDEMNIFTQTRMRANTGRMSMNVVTGEGVTDGYGNTNAGYTPEPESDCVRNSSSGIPSSPPNSPSHQPDTIPEEPPPVGTLETPVDKSRDRSRASSKSSVSSKKSVRSQGSVIDRFRISNKVDPDSCDRDSGQEDCDFPARDEIQVAQVTDENYNRKVQQRGNGTIKMIATDRQNGDDLHSES